MIDIKETLVTSGLGNKHTSILINSLSPQLPTHIFHHQKD